MAVLNVQLPTENINTSQSPMNNPIQLVKQLKDLLYVLEEDHGTALNLIVILSTKHHSELPAIEQAMNNFDSDLAKTLTEAWLAQLVKA